MKRTKRTKDFTIHLEYSPKPIPVRTWDWVATVDGEEEKFTAGGETWEKALSNLTLDLLDAGLELDTKRKQSMELSSRFQDAIKFARKDGAIAALTIARSKMCRGWGFAACSDSTQELKEQIERGEVEV